MSGSTGEKKSSLATDFLISAQFWGSSEVNHNFSFQSGLLDDLPLEASFLTASLDGAQKRLEEKESQFEEEKETAKRWVVEGQKQQNNQRQ